MVCGIRRDGLMPHFLSLWQGMGFFEALALCFQVFILSLQPKWKILPNTHFERHEKQDIHIDLPPYGMAMGTGPGISGACERRA